MWREIGEDPEVNFFYEIVAALVEAVDGALDAGYVGVGGLGVTGFVLFVPEVEVFAVLGGDEGEEFVCGSGLMGRGVVPGDGEGLVEAGDGCGFEHGLRGGDV